MAQESLAQVALLSRDGSDPAVADLAHQLLAVRNDLAAETLRGPAPGEEERHHQELAWLDEQEQTLAKQLGLATGRPARDDPWVELDEVRKALPADAVLVEIARLDLAGRRPRGLPVRAIYRLRPADTVSP